MNSFFRVPDPTALVGRGSAPRPRRLAAAETLFIGAAEGRNPGSTDDRRQRSIKCSEKYWGREQEGCFGGGGRCAAARSGASRGVREKSGRFGQDGPDRRRIDRPFHGVPPGGRLLSGKLRVLRALAAKRHALHCKADEKNGTVCEFEDIHADLREVLDRRIKDLEQRIKTRLDSDGALAETVAVARKLVVIANALCKSRELWASHANYGRRKPDDGPSAPNPAAKAPRPRRADNRCKPMDEIRPTPP